LGDRRIVEAVLPELDRIRACVVLYGRDLREGLPDALLQKPPKGIALDLDEIRQLNVGEL
jgi:hypothetical protein